MTSTLVKSVSKTRSVRALSIFDKRVAVSPGTIVRMSHADKHTPAWTGNIGQFFMVGFYSKQDGLDCIWLTDATGEYQQTTDHMFLFRYFTIAKPSLVTDFYGTKTRLPAWPKSLKQ